MGDWGRGEGAVGELDAMLVSVRVDTRGFARDVAEMRAALDGPLVAGADRAGRAIESTLLRAVRRGQLGFEDLRRVALSAMGEIAEAAIGGGLASLLGGRSAAPAGAGELLSGLLSALIGAPGRATGGPVSPGRVYRVGERGPEWFVPTSAGRVEAPVTALPAGREAPGMPMAAASPREVRVAITVNAAAGAAPAALQRSSRQVARAVKAALAGVD